VSARARILLLSAYDAASHQYWRNWLSASFPEYDWTCLTQPDRHFYWRIRSNALTFLEQHSEELSRGF